MRVGHGIDVHAFVQGRPLMLGGVAIEHDRGLAGHSDADVLLHAIIDAMLGAAALGDIGFMFPSSDGRWQGASSAEMLKLAHARVLDAGYALENLDTVLVAQEPRLASHVPAMRAAIAGTLGLDIERVSVKATTTDHLGFTGRGEGIAAFATVLLE
jgi:2-C-methyl-D-erythritol 2,4-cyclodiphosphate synthase